MGRRGSVGAARSVRANYVYTVCINLPCTGVRPVTPCRNAALSLRRIIQTAQIGSQIIHGIADSVAPFVENVRVDHGRFDVLPDVMARFQQMSREGAVGALPDIGRDRIRGGHGWRAEVPARFGSGALSLTDPMEPPPLVVTERNDGFEPTLDLARLSSCTTTMGVRHQNDIAHGPPRW